MTSGSALLRLAILASVGSKRWVLIFSRFPLRSLLPIYSGVHPLFFNLFRSCGDLLHLFSIFMYPRMTTSSRCAEVVDSATSSYGCQISLHYSLHIRLWPSMSGQANSHVRVTSLFPASVFPLSPNNTQFS
jgi:hypothetical protein